MEGIDSFTTKRMTAHRMTVADFANLHSLYTDVKVMKTLGGMRTEDETRSYLQRNFEHWQQHGFGLWMLHLKTGGTFVGRGGLRKYEVDGKEEIEVAYAVASPFWGQGLATEMARAFIRIAFDRLGHEDVVSFTLPTNLASRRVMEKAGMVYERDIIHADLPHVLYRRRAESES